MKRNVMIGVLAVVAGGALGVGVAGLPDHVSTDIVIETRPPATDGDVDVDVDSGVTGLTAIAPAAGTTTSSTPVTGTTPAG